MGLDTVELVMEVEQEFGITIDDRDAEKIMTVGMLYRYVLARLGRADVRIGPAPCLSAFAFYRARRTLLEQLGIDRGSIRPDAAMEGLVARPARREAWHGLAQVLGWRLPPLVRPRWLKESLYVAVSVGWSAGVVALFRLRADPTSILSWMALGVPTLALAAVLLTAPFARRFPAGAADLRALIHSALDLNPWAIRQQAGLPIAEGDVWDALIALVSEQAGVPPDMLTGDTSFVTDLA